MDTANTNAHALQQPPYPCSYAPIPSLTAYLTYEPGTRRTRGPRACEHEKGPAVMFARVGSFTHEAVHEQLCSCVALLPCGLGSASL